MPATYIVKNVSGEGNACYFRALTKSLGTAFIKDLLGLEEHQAITTASFRHYLSGLYKTSGKIRERFATALDILQFSPNITPEGIRDLLSVSSSIAGCIHMVLDKPIHKTQQLNAILDCCAEAIKADTMVSQIDVREIEYTINEKLHSLGKMLVILPIDASKLEDSGYIASKMLEAFNNIKRRTENESISINNDTTLYFIASSDIHYRYIVKKEGSNEITGISLYEIMAYFADPDHPPTVASFIGVNSPNVHSVGFGGARKVHKTRNARTQKKVR